MEPVPRSGIYGNGRDYVFVVKKAEGRKKAEGGRRKGREKRRKEEKETL